MDLFKKASRKTIGIGGVHCPCCNVYRSKGRQIKGLNKLRRTRLKRYLLNEIRG